MAAIELEISPELHERLKESAERNRRSLNAEIVWQLERVVTSNRRPSNEEILARVRRFHQHLDSIGFTPLTEEEVLDAIRQGRR